VWVPNPLTFDVGIQRAMISDTMKRRLRPFLLPLAAISIAFGQTEEQYRQFIAHIQRALALKTGAVVADIGTGESPEQPLHVAKAVGDSGKVICIDIDEKALDKLRAKLNGWPEKR
jgi:hypothetical protein